MKVLDEDETAAILEAAKGSRLYMPVLLAVTTGMRRGEILGLHWKDVDLAADTVTVRCSLEEARGGVRFKEPKTASGRRTLRLLPLTVEALKRHRVEQAENRLRMGPVYEDNGLVVCREDGRPWRPDRFSTEFILFIDELEIPRVRFHDLRHTHATLLLHQGISPKVVSERLGHSSTSFTLDVYGHVTPVMEEEAVRAVDAALRRAMEDHKSL